MSGWVSELGGRGREVNGRKGVDGEMQLRGQVRREGVETGREGGIGGAKELVS